MPKGTKIVDWTPENEAKLFHTIMAVHDIKVDNAKVAAAFGKVYPHLGPRPISPTILNYPPAILCLLDTLNVYSMVQPLNITSRSQRASHLHRY